jgi:hypothetical protein
MVTGWLIVRVVNGIWMEGGGVRAGGAPPSHLGHCTVVDVMKTVEMLGVARTVVAEPWTTV